MSDGMTEANRAMRLASAEDRILDALADHIEAPSAETWRRVIAEAEATDAMRPPRFMGRKGWADDIREMAEPMLARDEATWARFLHMILDVQPHGLSWGVGERLKALSPFAGKILVTMRDVADARPSGGETGDLARLAMRSARRFAVRGARGLAVVDPAGFPAAAG